MEIVNLTMTIVLVSFLQILIYLVSSKDIYIEGVIMLLLQRFTDGSSRSTPRSSRSVQRLNICINLDSNVYSISKMFCLYSSKYDGCLGCIIVHGFDKESFEAGSNSNRISYVPFCINSLGISMDLI